MTVGLLALVICYVVLIYVLMGMALIAMMLAVTAPDHLRRSALARRGWFYVMFDLAVAIVIWPWVLKWAFEA